MEFSAITVLDNMSEAVYVRDLDMNLVYVNPAAALLSGWEREDALDRKCYQVFGSKDQACRDLCPVQKAMDGDTPMTHDEGELQTLAGDVLRMRVSISPLKSKGSMTGAVVVMQDLAGLKVAEDRRLRDLMALEEEIKRRKTAEDALREANERLAATFEALPDILFEIDRDGRFYDCHAPSLDMLYLPPDQFLGKTIAEVLPDPPASQLMAGIAQALDRGRATGIVYSLTMGGTERWFEISLSPRGDPRTASGRLIVLVRDITRRQQATLELQDTVIELEQALAQVKRLSGLLPICSYCKKVRDDQGYWQQVEKYISEHSEAQFSHSICASCMEKHYPK